jgi:hypothetical protein
MKRAKYIIQQRDNAQYRTTTNSAQLIMGHTDGFIYEFMYTSRFAIIIIIIYLNCKWVFTRWQWYYNKTQHTK